METTRARGSQLASGAALSRRKFLASGASSFSAKATRTSGGNTRAASRRTAFISASDSVRASLARSVLRTNRAIFPALAAARKISRGSPAISRNPIADIALVFPRLVAKPQLLAQGEGGQLDAENVVGVGLRAARMDGAAKEKSVASGPGVQLAALQTWLDALRGKRGQPLRLLRVEHRRREQPGALPVLQAPVLDDGGLLALEDPGAGGLGLAAGQPAGIVVAALFGRGRQPQGVGAAIRRSICGIVGHEPLAGPPGFEPRRRSRLNLPDDRLCDLAHIAVDDAGPRFLPQLPVADVEADARRRHGFRLRGVSLGGRFASAPLAPAFWATAPRPVRRRAPSPRSAAPASGMA